MTESQKQEAQKWTIILILLAYFVMAGIIVALFVAFGRISREQAARAATVKAGAVSQRDNCYRMVDNNPDLIAIIEAVELNARNSVKANRAALAVNPTGPLAAVRKASIQRSLQAVRASRKFREQILSNTPTLERCNELALRLGLEPRPKEGK